MKSKMNFLYKIGFILMMICIPLLIAAIITAYLFQEKYFSAVFSAGGAFLAFVGIILAMLSKPKKVKEKIPKKQIILLTMKKTYVKIILAKGE